MIKVVDHKIIVSEFELQSRYYFHFQTYTFGKGINHIILQTMGDIIPLLVFFKDHFCLVLWQINHYRLFNTKSSLYMNIVTANWLKSQNGTLFSHVWRRGRLGLDPL